MKLFIIILLAFATTDCSNKKVGSSSCYKGRLEIKGICSNYTIKVLDGNIDTTKFQARWTDEHTGKEYTNVFGLNSPCDFPDTINEGEEFYFTIENEGKEGCMVCQAYYPTPAKKLHIRVLSQPCTQ
ncbi:MAG TPA: hypothetical protein VM368_02535 [Flavisolibacter sp.]|nr:hypothetical protein [Flavisolibacter sp.]